MREFRPSRKESGRIQWAYEGLIDTVGVTATMKGKRPRDRRWLQRRLKPSARQPEFERVLGGLGGK